MNAADRIATIAWIARAKGDVRPWLLLLFFDQSQAAVVPCIAYGVGYLHMWCRRVGLERLDRGCEAAAIDGLWIALHGRSLRSRGIHRTAAAAAAELHMRKADFTLLRTKSADVYRMRFVEAIADYHAELAGIPPERLAPAKAHDSIARTNQIWAGLPCSSLARIVAPGGPSFPPSWPSVMPVQGPES